MRAVGTEQCIFLIVCAELLGVCGVLLVGYILAIETLWNVHFLHLIGLVGNRVGKRIAIKLGLPVAQEDNVFQVLALSKGIVTNFNSSITHYYCLYIETVIESIVINLCHTLWKNDCLQSIKFPEHVLGNLIVILHIVILAVSVETDAVGVDADSCIIKVKIGHSGHYHLIAILLVTTAKHTQHGDILAVDGTIHLQCSDAYNVSADASYVVGCFHRHSESECIGECARLGNCNHFYLILGLSVALDVVGILRPSLAISILLANLYIDYKVLWKAFECICSQCGD